MDGTHSREAKDALLKIKTIIDVKPEELMNRYDQWAVEYDSDLKNIEYVTPSKSAKIFMKYIQEKQKELKVVDIACGTGLVGYELRKEGFKGLLHGIDGSKEMIEIARKKSIYDDLFFQYMKTDESIRTIPGTKYDGLICVGAFTNAHLDPKMLEKFSEILLPGGILIYTVRDSKDNECVLEGLEQEVNKLIDSGILEKLEVVRSQHGVNWESKKVEESQDVQVESTVTSLNVCCFRKI